MTRASVAASVVSASGPIRVAVVDARRLIADALATLIGGLDGFAVAGVAVCEKALDTIVARRPSLVLAGVGSDAPEALALVRSVCSRASDLEVVMVVDEIAPALVRFALEQGVGGLLHSDAPAREAAESMRQVVRGHAVFPAGWQRVLAADGSSAVQSLSERQREVLDLVTAGCSYDEIAGRLCITSNTVKSHVRSIYARLGVHNRMAAARLLGGSRR